MSGVLESRQEGSREEPPPGGCFRFEGLSPWRADWGLIECEVGDWVIDLHNVGYFLSVTYDSARRLTFAWYYHDPGPANGPSSPQLVRLVFDEVSGVSLTQDDELHELCRGETDGWDFEPDGAGAAQLSFNVDEAQVCFRATGVSLVAEPTTMEVPFPS